MSRKPIQVPEELHERLEGYKDKFYVKTHGNVIEKLIDYHEKDQRLRVQEREQRAREEEERQATMIYLGEELKTEYMKLKEELGLRSEESTLAFLLEHYRNSRTFDRFTFDFFRTLD